MRFMFCFVFFLFVSNFPQNTGGTQIRHNQDIGEKFARKISWFICIAHSGGRKQNKKQQRKRKTLIWFIERERNVQNIRKWQRQKETTAARLANAISLDRRNEHTESNTRNTRVEVNLGTEMGVPLSSYECEIAQIEGIKKLQKKKKSRSQIKLK